MILKYIFTLSFILALTQNIFSQSALLVQDSTLNNLIHPKEYKTCKLGELGAVIKTGSGKQSLILIAGLGFGNEVFDNIISKYKKQYTIYAITPAGFAGTLALPIPDTSAKFNKLSWTNGITTGVLNLIEKEKLNKPIIVASFVTATQVAFSLAINHSDKISSIIIIGGSPYRYYPGQKKDGTFSDWENEKIYTPEQREKAIKFYWAPKWFKTVTKKTWDDNMWTPDDYCKDTTIGNKLFKASAEVPLQVMIRYLIEWMAYDANEKYKDIKVPALILIPDFKELLTYDARDTVSCKSYASKIYLKYFHQATWQKAKDSGNTLITVQTVPDSRIFTWYDNPKTTYSLIDNFIKNK